jgi:hypothetical protein
MTVGNAAGGFVAYTVGIEPPERFIFCARCGAAVRASHFCAFREDRDVRQEHADRQEDAEE